MNTPPPISAPNNPLVWPNWLACPAGAYAAAWEQRALDAAVADCFGYLAAQMGCLELPALRENRISQQLLLQDFTQAPCSPYPPIAPQTPPAPSATPDAALAADRPRTALPPSLCCAFEELPLASQSLDLLVLPHGLDFARDPHQVLREVERVLRPEGHLVLTGFHPLSLWGMRQTARRFVGHDYLPAHAQPLGTLRVKDWLKLLGLEVLNCEQGVYAAPFRKAHWLDNCAWMERAGARWWPFLGAVYCIKAVKRVRGMRLIGPAWRHTKRLAPSLAPSASPAVQPKPRSGSTTPNTPSHS